jgi:hypothetical protein
MCRFSAHTHKRGDRVIQPEEKKMFRTLHGFDANGREIFTFHERTDLVVICAAKEWQAGHFATFTIGKE